MTVFAPPLLANARETYPGMCPVAAAAAEMETADAGERGAIFTRREVVNFVLDLAGYTPDKPLHNTRLLEPSFGGGDFLQAAVDRLLVAWCAAGQPEPIQALRDAVRAVEVHRDTFEATRDALVQRLRDQGLTATITQALTEAWLIRGDFLLVPLDGPFDVVVGNPPYVRQEMIPNALMVEYRARYRTIYDRADLYVPFIERSLHLLNNGGTCGFICSDRWMKNRYGGPLREMVAKDFHLKVYVDMVDTPAFHTEVVAYPAITVISREKAGTTRIAHRPAIDADALAALSKEMVRAGPPSIASGIHELQGVTVGASPWILESSDQLALVRRLERQFPSLEEAGCKVGIGVATGADKAFIGRYDDLDVEPSRKLPLAMTRDINSGVIEWRGFGVINPFRDDGRLVDLGEYPRLRAYLEARRDQIAGRHVAKKAPANWYRTIDRITPEIAARPKLLIPDIKGTANIVYENEGLYPHHNLYFITSDAWDMRALQAVLLSGIARLFVGIYSTKMRGGFLRFQAQYLRRIRLPLWGDVSSDMRTQLIGAAERRDIDACNRAVFELYGLSAVERAALGGEGE